jgi:hypothetical protein
LRQSADPSEPQQHSKGDLRPYAQITRHRFLRRIRTTVPTELRQKSHHPNPPLQLGQQLSLV